MRVGPETCLLESPLMTRLLISIALVAFFGSPGGAAAKAPPHMEWRGTVTSVVDGDTLWVRPASGAKPVKVRLDGVDAPEICQAYGEASRKALLAKLNRQSVTVYARQRDSFGRLLARVRLDRSGRGDVGAWLVREGHAWSYRYRRDVGPYAAQQALAKSARKGLFADANAQEPREYRKRHGACIEHVQY